VNIDLILKFNHAFLPFDMDFFCLFGFVSGINSKIYYFSNAIQIFQKCHTIYLKVKDGRRDRQTDRQTDR